jgi:hypothetical protein
MCGNQRDTVHSTQYVLYALNFGSLSIIPRKNLDFIRNIQALQRIVFYHNSIYPVLLISCS